MSPPIKLRTLSSDRVRMVEELVLWDAKVKDIQWLCETSDAEKLARSLYARMGKRPPNGVIGSATSRGLRLFTKLQYTALAAEFVAAVESGMNDKDAMVCVYRRYWSEYHARPGEASVSVSLWFSLARELNAKITNLWRCIGCGAQHLETEGQGRLNLRCPWCERQLPRSQFQRSEMRKTA